VPWTCPTYVSLAEMICRDGNTADSMRKRQYRMIPYALNPNIL
jgi:hypothetical protein